MRLKDRVAIVTGAASGIGRAIARALGAEGARVAILDLNEAGARDTAAAIGEAVALRTDVTARAEVDAAVAEVIRRWGAVHVLVNNAGWDRPVPFLDTDEAFWDKILALNLKAHFHLAQAVLPQMIRQGGGRVVAIASDAGRVGSSGEAVYSAAKGGVIAFTKTLAREMARHRINVNCVCPGPSETPLFQTEFTAGRPGARRRAKKAIPWGRLGRPRGRGRRRRVSGVRRRRVHHRPDPVGIRRADDDLSHAPARPRSCASVSVSCPPPRRRRAAPRRAGRGGRVRRRLGTGRAVLPRRLRHARRRGTGHAPRPARTLRHRPVLAPSGG